jgi:hypothetical protein
MLPHKKNAEIKPISSKVSYFGIKVSTPEGHWWYFINPSIGVACTLPSLNPSFSAASLNSS